MVAAAFLGVILAGYGAYATGIPWLARTMAERLPPGLEATIAEEGMRQLDALVLKPSGLHEARTGKLQGVFAGLTRAAGLAGAQLEFRDGGWLGANAFALPGGTVVMTDRLAQVLDDEAIAAVFAHELGHVHGRHAARQILQASAITLAALAVFGDVSSVAGLASGIPTLIVYTGYSRDFEREADQYAFELLRKTGRSPRLLGDSLTALEGQRQWGRGDDEGYGYLRTHPTTRERVEAAEAAARP